jgi:hypothetical protein
MTEVHAKATRRNSLPGHLPWETWHHIITYIPDVQVQSVMSRVNRTFHQLATDRMLWLEWQHELYPRQLAQGLTKPQRLDPQSLVNRGIMRGFSSRHVQEGGCLSVPMPVLNTMPIVKRRLENALGRRARAASWTGPINAFSVGTPPASVTEHRAHALEHAFTRDSLVQQLRRRPSLQDVVGTLDGGRAMEASVLCPALQPRVSFWEARGGDAPASL